MRIKSVLAGIIASAVVMWADNMILDFETIARIELNLKPNQTLMIDHKRGVLLGIMEIQSNGSIKRLPIPKELLGKNEADVMGGKKSGYESTTSHFGGAQTTIYSKTQKDKKGDTSSNVAKIKGTAQIPSGKQKGVENSKAGNTKRAGDFEWDKSKIIYEQQEETLEIER